MAYGRDLAKSARRHLRAADELHGLSSSGAQPGCGAVAGYLYGLCGELAIKEMMRDSGMTPLAECNRRDDPFYAHFPVLKTLLLDSAKGRRAGELRTLAETGSLFQQWDTAMRYAPTGDIREEWIGKWQESARELVAQMEAP